MDTDPHARTAELNGITLHYQDRGQGEPLLLLHGFGGTSADWSLVFDLGALASERRVLALDLRAHGRSTGASGPFSIRQCGHDVLALLDRLGIERFEAVGLSLGAKTMLHAATAQPGRVRAMVLASAAPYFPERTRALIRRMASAERSADEWAQMRARHAHGDEQIRALWRHAASLADQPDDMSFTAASLSVIEAPTLLVAGDRDPLYPVELSVELFRAIPFASLWVVPGGGHGPIFNEQSEPFARAALAFLRQA